MMMNQGYFSITFQASSWFWMLESAVLLNEIMKISGHSAASFVVRQVIAMDAFSSN
jgi:hypothetical protein